MAVFLRVQVLESKGLDVVRRDWCQLSRDVGKRCLEDILSGKEQDEIVEAVHERLRGVAARITAGEVPLNDFLVSKQLTKRPEEYPDAKAQAHVQVRCRCWVPPVLTSGVVCHRATLLRTATAPCLMSCTCSALCGLLPNNRGQWYDPAVRRYAGGAADAEPRHARGHAAGRRGPVRHLQGRGRCVISSCRRHVCRWRCGCEAGACAKARSRETWFSTSSARTRPLAARRARARGWQSARTTPRKWWRTPTCRCELVLCDHMLSL